MAEVSYDLDDVTLRATVSGSGPTVLLLHAGAERREVWRPVVPELAAAGLRSVAVDLRGHGESTGHATALSPVAGDVAEVIDRERAPMVVVGASLGGVAAMSALADPCRARRVAGLVLVDVVPDPDPVRVRAWLDTHEQPDLRDRHGDLVEDVLASGARLHAVTSSLALPILLIRAGHRSPLGDRDADRLQRAHPHTRVTRIADAGHLVARDAPTELGRLVAGHASAWLHVVPDDDGRPRT